MDEAVVEVVARAIDEAIYGRRLTDEEWATRCRWYLDAHSIRMGGPAMPFVAAEVAITAHIQALEAAGLVIVSKEPTEAMIAAGDEAQTETTGPETGFQVAMSSRVPWRAMLAEAHATKEPVKHPEPE
jgi:hypothetical protein